MSKTKLELTWIGKDKRPKLTPTNVVEGREARVHRMPPSPDRWKERSRTYQGVADAMAAPGNLTAKYTVTHCIFPIDISAHHF